SHRAWLFLITVWTVAVLIVFVLGTFSIWSPLHHSPHNSEARHTFLTFGLGGLAWALVQPLGLWWVRYRRGAPSIEFYLFAAIGILLHAVALAPGGYSIRTYALLSTVGLSAYVLFVVTIGIFRLCSTDNVVRLTGFATVGLLPVLAAAF